jgi:hypothetical protein
MAELSLRSGRTNHHVEALFIKGGIFRLYMLGQDQTQVQTVDKAQELVAYLQTRELKQAVPVEMQATPQPGDPEGQTSVFEGQVPLELIGSDLLVIVPAINIAGARYRLSFLSQNEHEAQMPRKVTADAEKQLYLTPGGKLTAEDIIANGSETASDRFRGFKSQHDMHPKQGELVCPITRTKANPECAWVIGGKTYTFCCPPCIDEFVKLAKEHPEEIKDPEAYVQE